MTIMSDALSEFCITPGNTAAIALSTDGIRKSSKVAMIAIAPLEGQALSVFIKGADISATRPYHGIPDEVYHSLAVDPEDVLSTLSQWMAQNGITTLVAHQAFTFVKDRLLDQKLVPPGTSFFDPCLLHKAIRNWSGSFLEATNLIDLQARIERVRGKNRINRPRFYGCERNLLFFVYKCKLLFCKTTSL